MSSRKERATARKVVQAATFWFLSEDVPVETCERALADAVVEHLIASGIWPEPTTAGAA